MPIKPWLSTLLMASLIAVALSTIPLAAEQAAVSGQLTVDDATIRPTHGVALHTRSTGYKPRDVIKIYLGSNAIDTDSAYSAVDVNDAIRGQLEGDFLVITLEPDGKLSNVYAFVDEGTRNFGFGTGGHIDLASLTADQVSARIFTKERQMLMDSPFEFDLEFSTPVLPKRKAKSRLPKGGGAAGKAYSAYVKAMQDGDVAVLVRHGSIDLAAELQETSEDRIGYRLEGLADFAPQQVEVTGGDLFDGFAILTVNGKDYSGEKVEGPVKMVKDGESWRFEAEDLSYAW